MIMLETDISKMKGKNREHFALFISYIFEFVTLANLSQLSK